MVTQLTATGTGQVVSLNEWQGDKGETLTQVEIAFLGEKLKVMKPRNLEFELHEGDVIEVRGTPYGKGDQLKLAGLVLVKPGEGTSSSIFARKKAA